MDVQDNETELFQEIIIEKEDTGLNLMDEPFNPADIDIDTKTPVLYKK